LTNVKITIEEAAWDTVILTQQDNDCRGSVNFASYKIPIAATITGLKVSVAEVK
jgi:hypothetical protein